MLSQAVCLVAQKSRSLQDSSAARAVASRGDWYGKEDAFAMTLSPLPSRVP